MIRFATSFLFLLLIGVQPARAENSPAPRATAPIVNFSLPAFSNPDGYRTWLVRGSEAWMTDVHLIDVKELNLTLFSGDAAGRIEVMMLSPAARVLPDELVVTGAASLRVINLHDGFEATGEDWRFTYKTKTVTFAKNVRVVLHTEFKNLLK